MRLLTSNIFRLCIVILSFFFHSNIRGQYTDTIKDNSKDYITVNHFDKDNQLYKIEEIKSDTVQKITIYNGYWGTYTVSYPVQGVEEKYSSNKILLSRNSSQGYEKYTSEGVLYEQKSYRSCPTCADSLYQYNEDDGIITSIERNYVEGELSRHLITYSSEKEGLILGERFEYRDTSNSYFEYEYDDLQKRYYTAFEEPFKDYRDSVNIYSEHGTNITGTISYSFYNGMKYKTMWERDKLVTHYYYDNNGVLIDSATIKIVTTFAESFNELPHSYWNKYEPFSDRPIFKIELYQDKNIKSYAKYEYDDYYDESIVELTSFDSLGNGTSIQLKLSSDDYFKTFENGDTRTETKVNRYDRKAWWADSTYFIYEGCALDEDRVYVGYERKGASRTEVFYNNDWLPLNSTDDSGKYLEEVIYEYDSSYNLITINHKNDRDSSGTGTYRYKHVTSHKYERFNSKRKTVYYYEEDNSGRVIRQFAYDQKGKKLRYDMSLDTLKNEGYERYYSPKGKLQWENKLTNKGYEGWTLEGLGYDLFDSEHEYYLTEKDKEDFFTEPDQYNNLDSVWYSKCMYQNGIRHGTYLARGGTHGQYQNGLKTGLWTNVSWTNGQLGLGETYYIGHYQNDLKSGLWIQTFETGDTLKYNTYVRDTLHGEVRTYDRGQFVESREYNMGKPTDENQSGTYTINRPFIYGEVVDDKREGQWKMEFDDGWVYLDFVNDQPNGMYYWLSFDQQDTLEIAQIFGGDWEIKNDYRLDYDDRTYMTRDLERNGLTVYKGDSLIFENNKVINSYNRWNNTFSWRRFIEKKVQITTPSTYSYYNNAIIVKGANGYVTNFDEDGHLISEGNIEKGERTGDWKFYYPNGMIEKTGTYHIGQETGEWQYFDEYGQPLKQEAKTFGITREESAKLYTNIIIPLSSYSSLSDYKSLEFIVNGNKTFTLLNTTQYDEYSSESTPSFELINLNDNKIVKRFTQSTIPYYPGMELSLIALSNNGKYMAAYRPYETKGTQAQFNDTIYIYDLNTEEVVRQCFHRDSDHSIYSRMSPSDILSMHFTNNDSCLLLTTNSEEIIKYDLSTGKQIKKKWAGEENVEGNVEKVLVYPHQNKYIVEQGDFLLYYDLNSFKKIESTPLPFSDKISKTLYHIDRYIDKGKKSDITHTLYDPLTKDSVSFSQKELLKQIDKKIGYLDLSLFNAIVQEKRCVLWFNGGFNEFGINIRITMDRETNKVLHYNLSSDWSMPNSPINLDSKSIFVLDIPLSIEIENFELLNTDNRHLTTLYKYDMESFEIEEINQGSKLGSMSYASPQNEMLELGNYTIAYDEYGENAFQQSKHRFNLSTLGYTHANFSMSRKDDYDDPFYIALDSIYYLSEKSYVPDSVDIPDYLKSKGMVLSESSGRYSVLEASLWYHESFEEIEFINDNKTAFHEKFVKLSMIDSSDYIFYCPDRYYFASRDASKKIYFEHNLNNYPFEQFDLKYNRPDIILDRLGYADSSLVAAYHKAYLKRLKKMGFTEDMLKDDFHLPEIEIKNYESIPSIIDQEEIDLNLHFEDSKYPLDRINIWVNDVAILGTSGISLREQNVKSLDKNISIPLAKGQNKIQISVLNQAGAESFKETVELECTKGKTQPNLYLITLGASEFQQSDYNLTYAAKDAKDITNQLSKSTVYNEVFTQTLTNVELTRENVIGLKSFLEKADINDHVMIFLAGHGVLSVDLDYYLATYDMNFDHPEDRGLMYEDLESLLDGIKPLQKVLFIDACHSGEIDKEEVEFSQAENTEEGDVQFRAVGKTVRSKLGSSNTLELTKSLFTDLRKGTGATVISSAGGMEFAIESATWQNGLFTYALLDGLKSGDADLNNDGEIWLSELQEHIEIQVLYMSRGKQHPTSRIENQTVDFRIW